MSEKQNSNKTEDIFSDVEVMSKTSVTQIEGQSVQTQRQEPKLKKRFNFGIIIRLLVILVVLALLVLGIWFLFFKKLETSKETEVLVEEQGAFVTTTPAVTGISAENIDTDNDGLTDVEERELGTNPESLDSDNDGLSDKEEVKIYLTDPLDSDTDKDNIEDGQEVKNNRNPRNPDPEARLFDLQKEIDSLK